MSNQTTTQKAIQDCFEETRRINTLPLEEVVEDEVMNQRCERKKTVDSSAYPVEVGGETSPALFDIAVNSLLEDIDGFIGEVMDRIEGPLERQEASIRGIPAFSKVVIE